MSMDRIIRGLGIVPVQSSFIHLLYNHVLSMCCVEGSVLAIKDSPALNGPVSRRMESEIWVMSGSSE